MQGYYHHIFIYLFILDNNSNNSNVNRSKSNDSSVIEPISRDSIIAELKLCTDSLDLFNKARDLIPVVRALGEPVNLLHNMYMDRRREELIENSFRDMVPNDDQLDWMNLHINQDPNTIDWVFDPIGETGKTAFTMYMAEWFNVQRVDELYDIKTIAEQWEGGHTFIEWHNKDTFIKGLMIQFKLGQVNIGINGETILRERDYSIVPMKVPLHVIVFASFKIPEKTINGINIVVHDVIGDKSHLNNELLYADMDEHKTDYMEIE